MQSFTQSSILLLPCPLLTTLYLMFSAEILKETSTMGRTYSRDYNLYLKKTSQQVDTEMSDFRKMGNLGINLHISWDYYGQKWEGLLM